MKKIVLKTSILSLAAVVALSTVGCSSGGSSDDTAPVTSVTTSGVGIDGILSGSKVCIDVNANSVCDAGEDSTTTNGDGEFTLTSTQKGTLLLVGGNDIGTGLPFTGSLKAPAGSTVITPLTSALQAMVENGSSAADAETSLKAALGIDPTVVLTTFDPLKEILNATPAQAAKAKDVLVAQAQLQTIVHAAAATVAGADGEAGENDIAGAMDNVFKEIAKNFVGATTEVTLTQAQVATATKAVATTVYATNPAALVAVKATADASALNAVATAKTTAATIEAGTPADATTNFNAAIVQANTTLQDAVQDAAIAAEVKAAALTPDQLKVISDAQAAQEAEEAKIAAATKAAQDAAAALEAATSQTYADKAAFEAYLAAVVASEKAAAAEAAAKAAALEAAAAAAQAEADLAADKDAAKAAADAEAAAAKAAADAEAAAAELRIAAAEAVAKAAQEEEDLTAAQTAAAQAAADAAAAIAAAEKVAADLAAAEAARIAAEAAAAEAAAIAAQEAAAEQALLATKARIEILVTTVTNVDSNVSATLTTAQGIAAKVSTDMLAIFAIATNYSDAQTKAADANTTANEAGVAYLAAQASATLISNAKTAILQAKTDVNETAAQTQEAAALAAKVIFDEKIALASIKAQAVGAILTEVQAIKTTADANEAARVLLAIAAYKTQAASDLVLIQASSSAATQNATEARTAATAAQTIANTVAAAQAEATAATAAATVAEAATATVETLAAEALTHKNITDSATTEEVAAQNAGFVRAKVEPAAVAATTAAAEAAKAATALAGAQALVANYAVEGPSENVSAAVGSLNTFDPQNASLTELVAGIKNTLGTENKDEIILGAIVEIIDVINSAEMSNLMSATTRFTDSPVAIPNLDALVNDGNSTISLATTASTLGGTDVMHTMASKLKAAADALEANFDNAKVLSYDGVYVNYDDSLVLRAFALSAATALDTFASYSYGDIAYFTTKTKSINNESYEYSEASVDPLTMMQQATFFKMANTSRLAIAGGYAKAAAELMASVDVSKVTIQELSQATNADAQKLVDAFNGNGEWSTGESKIESINVNKLFSLNEYIDRDDVTIGASYLGKGATEIAEYEKIETLKDEWMAYDLAQCEAYDVNRTQPTSWDTINWDLLYSEGNTPVTLLTDPSIVNGEPVYRVETYDYSWIDYNNNCAVVTQTYMEALTPNMNLEPKASFDDVFKPYNIVDYVAVGDVFYEEFDDMDGRGYAAMTVLSDTQIQRHEQFYPWGSSSASNEWTETFTYEKTDNAIKVIVPASTSNAGAYFYYKIDSMHIGLGGDEIDVILEKDYGQDGVIDEEERRLWYTYQRSYFPEDI